VWSTELVRKLWRIEIFFNLPELDFQAFSRSACSQSLHRLSYRGSWTKDKITTDKFRVKYSTGFPCRFYTPMPQLTSNCDRVIVWGLQTSDTAHYNATNAIKICLMIVDIRTREDFCLSDIYVLDLANLSLGHVAMFTVLDMKKLALCSFVSTEIFLLYMLITAQSYIVQSNSCCKFHANWNLSSAHPLTYNINNIL
jgi:hypothetical protein